MAENTSNIDELKVHLDTLFNFASQVSYTQNHLLPVIQAGKSLIGIKFVLMIGFFRRENLLNGHLSRNSLQKISMKNYMKLTQKKMIVGFLKPLMINQLTENGGQATILMVFQAM